ncbi:hypothetical protein Pcinc_029513 [Petrolisthes cinctipes]|uniref:Uncharacterized protein n=1 Tax=Petrolisthes cinctipes TaxID=88211 RepID=A0AAE1BT48_PETCI|nr:hypothetical protein Pcinc_037903 [Petrolisthes cinctipes]KAK3864825.1 hypothetical protein Pcinc_029513 [Petrolisthes cinctipes]
MKVRWKRNSPTKKRKGVRTNMRRKERGGRLRNKSSARKYRRRHLKVKSVECDSVRGQGSFCQPQALVACIDTDRDTCVNITCVCRYKSPVQISGVGQVA